jgi:hypothetical protein
MQSPFDIHENAELELGTPGKRKGCLILTFEAASFRVLRARRLRQGGSRTAPKYDNNRR